MAEKKFKTEVADLLQLIIHSLYSNKEIFLRELVSNASDAIDKLRYLSLTDEKFKDEGGEGRIDITYTESAPRTLTIKDNGLGMDEKELEEDLGTIASSGTRKFLEALKEGDKKDSNLIGQFGVGFYSAFMVADKIEVVSRKAGKEKAYKWTSDGKSTYSIEESERDGHGTTITLHLNEEGVMYANRYEIERLVRKYSDHVAYPIYLEYDKVNYDYEHKDENGEPTKKSEHRIDKINSSSALWRRPKSEIKDEEYKEFYKNNYYDSEDPLFYIHTKAEGAVEYTTLFYIPSKAPFDMYYADYTPGVKLYVKRVYITDDDKTLLPTYLRFVRGVIDSEDLPLNVSREILQENRIMAQIRNGSVKKLLSEFKKMSEQNPELYTKFIAQYNRPLKEGLYSDYANRDALMDLVRFHSSSVDGYVSLSDYKERMKEGQKAIYYITGGKEETLKSSPLVASYKEKGYEVLIMDDEIDEIVVTQLYEYKELPFKAINTSGALDEEKSDEEKKKEEDKKPLLEKIRKALDGKVKDVVFSTRLGQDTPACVIMDENDPSVRMQRMLKSMGGDAPEAKPILEVNAESDLVKRIEKSDEDELVGRLSRVLLGNAMLQEGLMPEDPVGFSKDLSSLL